MRRSFRKAIATGLAAVTMVTSVFFGGGTLQKVMADENYDVIVETKYSDYTYSTYTDALIFYNMKEVTKGEQTDYILDVDVPVKYVTSAGKEVEISLKNTDGTAKYSGVSGNCLMAAGSDTCAIINEDGNLINADLKYKQILGFENVGFYMGDNGDGTYTIFDESEKVLKKDFKFKYDTMGYGTYAFAFAGKYFFIDMYTDNQGQFLDRFQITDAAFNNVDVTLENIKSYSLRDEYLYMLTGDDKLMVYDTSFTKKDIAYTLPENAKEIYWCGFRYSSDNTKDVNLYVTYADKDGMWQEQLYKILVAEGKTEAFKADTTEYKAAIGFKDGGIYRTSDESMIMTAKDIETEIKKLSSDYKSISRMSYSSYSGNELARVVVTYNTADSVKSATFIFDNAYNYSYDKVLIFNGEANYYRMNYKKGVSYYRITDDTGMYVYTNGTLYSDVYAMSMYGFIVRKTDSEGKVTEEKAYDLDGNLILSGKNLEYVWCDGYIIVSNGEEDYKDVKVGLIGPKATVEDMSGAVSSTEAAVIQSKSKVEGEGVPSGAELVVKAVTRYSKNYATVQKYVADKLKEEKFATLDLTLFAGDAKVQPNGKIKITLPVMSNISTAKRIEVYRLNEETNALDKVDSADVKDGMFTFETDHFSTYVFVEVTPTGDATSTAMIMLLAGVLLLSGAVLVVCAKKRA